MRELKISDMIQKLRKSKKLTQSQLAECVGVSIAAVSKWENGLSYPDITLLPSLAAIFEVSIDKLFSYNLNSDGSDIITRIKKNFEEEAKEYDSRILKLIPCYEQMINAMISVIPFDKDTSINVIDIGAGTGNVSKAIKDRFKNSKITCLDISKNMIGVAKLKLKGYSDVKYEIEDFYSYSFKEKYDVVISSLSLHHLSTDNDKKNFYKKIYDFLYDEGVFYNLDLVLGSSDIIQNLYISQWKEFMYKSISNEEIDNKLMRKYYEEDNPSKLIDQIHWLENIGFKNVDIIFKYFNYAIYGGMK
ncbi:methyltransferase, type 12 [Gottschalkia acidurici 9a]|uniref:Methyltransferase, type 12 n=1 Tax=Gottschalkia acidurici (strain ATCC 7906 / DSM 604 / BCRC 14475 / CIP 104303 / KCTC 5404 / NCIMB 10678 / 9a) TaxID=1128398 RepID=K0AVA0_GOTA9|nr:methyltransferase [Gottschalkia acidurici]AFS77783.1 methyltransferase, type 12 [Gottschalkia acidurici 9a]